jgi:hypothetical protein
MEPYRILRNAIEQIVGTDVGYYQIGSNQAPALMVVPPEPFTTWRPAGLEVIINREPRLLDYGYHSGLKRVYVWEVILNQWDRDNFNQLTTVRDRILTEFLGLATHTYQPQTDSAYERCNIFIQIQKYIRRT